MRQMSDYYAHAELAFAAYANLFPGVNPVPALRESTVGMSSTQAARFASRWRVVEQYNHSEEVPVLDEFGQSTGNFTTVSNGLSATVFEEVATGKRYLAIRGTDRWLSADLTADGGILLHGVPGLSAQYRSLRERILQWQSDGTLSGTFTVAGHSLGGWLAAGLASELGAQIEHAYLYNAPGVSGLPGDIGQLLSSALGRPLSVIGLERVSNLRASAGASLTAGLGIPVSSPIAIEIEAASGLGVGNHSISRLTDALALYDAFAGLAPALTVEDIGLLLRAASAQNNRTLESSLDALRVLLGDEAALGSGATPTEDRDKLYANLYALQDSAAYRGLAGTAAVRVTAQLGAATLTAQAKQDFGHFLAVRHLLPFAIEGASSAIVSAHADLYARWSADRARRSAGATGLEFTDAYLADRAAFLTWQNAAHTADVTTILDAAFVPGARLRYTDLPSAVTVTISNAVLAPGEDTTKRFVFGGENAEVVSGGSFADRLYGGGGSDLLQGRAGDDYLEGGAGQDVYQYNASQGLLVGQTNDGSDEIRDTDGRGVIRYTYTQGGVFSDTVNSKVIGGLGIKLSDTEWRTPDGKFIYTRQFSGLLVTINGDAGGTLMLKDFQDGDFGIRLMGALEDLAPVNFDIKGDLQPIDFDPPNNSYRHDALGNVIVDSSTPAPDRADTLFDSVDSDYIDAGGGDDVVYARRGGGDWILGGAGRDWIQGGDALDLIEGGAGDDVLVGGGGDDRLYARDKVALDAAVRAGETAPSFPVRGEILSAGDGDDIAIGSGSQDFLLGGDGKDVIVGGGGDDTIYGDAGLAWARLDWTITRTRTESGGMVTFHVAATDAGWSEDSARGAADAIYGGAGVDWIFAGAGDDYVEGGAGEDAVLGEAGSDILIGGDGDDVLAGDSASTPLALQGDDYLDGGAGEDLLLGAGGDDILLGGEAGDTLVGGEGNDLLWGGAGDDILAGGAGKDTYFFGRGDGIEVVEDTPAGAEDPEASVLVLGEGISKDDIKFRLGSLVVDLGEGDAIHFNGFDADDPASTPVLASILFADGTSMSYQDILERGFDLDGTEGDNLIEGTAVTDRIEARGGNDTVIGKSGDDAIDGGAGEDLLAGDFGNDILLGGEGNDGLDGGDGNDALRGGAGEDSLAGGIGDDSLNGGTGADLLAGEAGSDVYTFTAGDGEDVIDEQGLLAIGVPDGGTDVVRFAAGVEAARVTLTHEANGDLVIGYGAGDRITVRGQFTTVGNAIERIEFDDGTAIDSSALNALPVAPIVGTAGDDALTGTGRPDTIRSLAGDDTLDGAGGDDVLEGGAGADSYAVYPGMGKDTLIDASPTADETGTLSLAEGLNPASFKAERRGNDLYLALRGAQDAVTIRGYYAPGAAQNWQVKESDGTLTALEDALALPEPSADVAARQAMQGYERGVLAAWAAQSRPAQLPTHAYLQGSWSQTIVYSRDSLFPWVLGPIERLLPPVSHYSVIAYGVRAGGRFERVVPAGRSIVPTIHAQASDEAQIGPLGGTRENVTSERHIVSYAQFIPGGQLTKAVFAVDLETTNVIVSTTGRQWVGITLDGSGPVREVLNVGQHMVQAAVEKITAGDSANVIQGGAGPYHVALIDAGGGDDTVTAGAFDFVYGGEGNDRVTGGKVVLGGNGDDMLVDGANLYGGAGDDMLVGGAFMAGGEGNDVLTGQEGVNLYAFDVLEAGVDAVADSGGITRAAFEDWYYRQLGIPTPEENLALGGWWGVIGDTGRVLADNRNRGGQSLGRPNFFYNDGDFSGGEWPSVAFANQSDLRAELARFRLPYRAQDIRYIAPLPPAPEVHANDYAALQPLYDAGLIEQDTVEFGAAGIAPGDLTLVREVSTASGTAVDSTLVISWGRGKGVRVALAQAQDAIGTGIERYRFADGTVMMTKDLLALATPLLLHDGPDEYVFAVGQGARVLAAEYRYVFFEPAIAPAEITVGRDGIDLVISLTGSDDSLRVVGWYTDPQAIPPVTATFDNGGATLGTADLTAAGLQLRGTAADDQLTGLDGFNDVIYGEGGSDTMVGGTGDDTYVYDEGGGMDVVFDAGGADVLRFGAGIAAADVLITRDPYGTLYLEVNGPRNRIAFDEWFGAGRVERVEFADGTVWDDAALEARIVTAPATEFADILNLTDGDDAIDALGGDDRVFGHAGSDILKGSAGDDFIEARDGGDLLDGGAGSDYLFGEGRSFVVGGAGEDFIQSNGDGTVIAFNPGDGQDTVYAMGSLTLSLGGGVGVADLSLSRDGDDLVLAVGASDSIRLTRQFEADPQAWPAITLQLFGSVHTFDFSAVIADFQAAFAADPGLGSFPIGNSLEAHRIGSSATEALGGALAHRYGTTRSLDGLNGMQIRQVLADPAFGTAAQPIMLRGENLPPVVASAIADQAAQEDAPFSFAVPAGTFADPDAGDTLTFEATVADGAPLPGWLSFDAASRMFSGTPAQADVGALEVRVTATDAGGLSAFDTFTVSVANVNDAPVLANPIADQAATEDAPFSFTVPSDTFADEDPGDAIAWFASRADGSALPGWLSFDSATRTLAGTPSNADVGSVEVTVRATDGAGRSAADTFALGVANVNDAPQLFSGAGDRQAVAGRPFSMTLPADQFVDADAGDVLTLAVQNASGGPLPAWLSFDAASRTLAGTPGAADAGLVRVVVTATDAAGESASDLFRISVEHAGNTAPVVANAPGERFVAAGSPFAFALAADTFADPDSGDALVYSASSYDGAPLPGWLAFDPATLGFSGTAPAAAIGAWPVAVTASDAAGVSAVAAFNLAVRSAEGGTVTGNGGDNVLYGNTGGETLIGRGGNDGLFGFEGNDTLRGGGGNDVLQGGAGADVLHAGSGYNLLDGGSGDDLIHGGRDGDLIIGGTGNDIIRTGRGRDIIAFNRGDGQDTVYSDREGNNTLSLGGGIRYEDLRLRKSGKDLVLELGGSDSITFKHWYSGQGRTSLLNIQIVTEAMAGFDDAAGDPLRGSRVNNFDAAGLVNAFDAARAADPYLDSWALSGALAQFHLWGSDGVALGGDLAYQYGLRRSLAGISLAAAQEAIGAPGFGADAQSLRPFSGLSEGFVKLG